jgi:hypothetical protein
LTRLRSSLVLPKAVWLIVVRLYHLHRRLRSDMAKAKSTVNAAGNYTKPELRKKIVSQVKAAATQGTGAGKWSARKAQLVAKKYKAAGGGYKD